jgi:protein arginine N-methyltransferase 1
MYSVASFGQMIADEVRMTAYEAAIRVAVRPGAVVLDVGAGTGILSLLACRAGARKVYAVEPGEAIALAAEIARANGLGDRIECLAAKSTDITLPERADVIVSDLRGVLPFHEQHIPSIADARRRHLAPEGVLIPARDDVHCAVVEAGNAYARVTAPWARDRFGFEMDAARAIVTNTWERAFFTPDQLLGEPAHVATIDYRTVESPDLDVTVVLTARRAGVAHGLAVWFDAVLADGTGFSNAPGTPETVCGAGFFPFATPIEAAAGDRFDVRLRADLVNAEYIWTWETTLPGDESAGVPPRASLRQSTFFGGPLPLEKVRRRAAGHRPRLNADGELDATILAAMTGACPIDAIVTEILGRFPGRFRSRAEALARVSDLSERYSQ